MNPTTVIACVALACSTIAASASAEPRGLESATDLQVLQEKNSARSRVVIDDRNYLVTPDTRLEDAWGREITLDDLPVPETSATRDGIRSGEGVTVQIQSSQEAGTLRLLELRYLPSRER